MTLDGSAASDYRRTGRRARGSHGGRYGAKGSHSSLPLEEATRGLLYLSTTIYTIWDWADSERESPALGHSRPSACAFLTRGTRGDNVIEYMSEHAQTRHEDERVCTRATCGGSCKVRFRAYSPSHPYKRMVHCDLAMGLELTHNDSCMFFCAHIVARLLLLKFFNNKKPCHIVKHVIHPLALNGPAV